MNEEFLFTPSQNHESDASPAECFMDNFLDGMHHAAYSSINLGDVMASTAKYNRVVWTNDNWRRLTLESMAVRCLEQMKFGCLNAWNTAIGMVILQHRGTLGAEFAHLFHD